MTEHPLTDKKALEKFWEHAVEDADLLDGQHGVYVVRVIDTVITWEYCETNVLYIPDGIRAAADWQLYQVMKWLKFGYQTDPNLSEEKKQIGGFMEIATALEEAMRPTKTTTQENNS